MHHAAESLRVDKKLRYSFYRANTINNIANDGNEMSQFRTFPCSHRFIRNWNDCFIHGTFKKHLLLPIFTLLKVYISYQNDLKSCNNMKIKSARDIPVYMYTA